MPPPNPETTQQPNLDTGQNNNHTHTHTKSTHHASLHADLHHADLHATMLISNTQVRIEATLLQRERERENKLVKKLYKLAIVPYYI